MSETAPVRVEITDEAIEAAARVNIIGRWEQKSDRERAIHLSRARAVLEAAAPLLGPRPLPLAGIQMVDIAAEAREMYGAHANEIAGRELPEHEWRFELPFRAGGRATMHHGATADDVQAYIAMRRAEGQEVELARPMPTYKQLAAAIVPHYPHPVFGCECTPVLADGTKEVLDQDWSEHVANVVLARLNGAEP